MSELSTPTKLSADIVNADEGLSYIEKFLQAKTWYLSTIDADGFPYSRPMSLLIRHEDSLYFATAKGKDMVRHIEANPHVGIYAAIHGAGKMRIRAYAHACYSDDLAQKFFEYHPRHYQRYVGEDPHQAQFFKLEKLCVEYMANYKNYTIICA